MQVVSRSPRPGRTPTAMTSARRPAEMVRTHLRLTSSVGQSAFSSDHWREQLFARAVPQLPVPLVHQDGGTESVQRVFEEYEVVPAPEQ